MQSVDWLGSVVKKALPSSVRTPNNIARETLQAVMSSFLTRVHLCIEEGGGHLKDIAHKKWN